MWTRAAIWIGVLGAFLCAGAVSAKDKKAPNVVLIVADDLGYADVSAYSADRIPTPHIDALARRGVRFTSGYATAPVCSPSRAALLTGRYQQRSGFEYLTDASPEGAAVSGISPRETTLAEMLHANGYRTAALGKWHLGSARKFWPTTRGFDRFFGFLRGEIAHIDADQPEAISAPVAYLGDRNFHRNPDWPIVRMKAGSDQQQVVDNADRYLPEVLGEEARDYIAQNRSKPFFLYVATSVPHSPLQTTQKYWDRFPAIKEKPRRVYAGMVSALDDMVGTITASLEENGVLDNTVIMFVSDNGCAAYMGQGICDCSVLSGGKLSQLEGGSRVPFIVSWPGRLPENVVEDEPVSTLDFVPTVLAGIPHNLPVRHAALDGVDLAKIVSKDSASQRPIFFRMEPFSWMRLGEWKMIRDGRLEQFNKSGYGTAKNPVVISLYNLREDPLETRDLAYENPDLVGRMSSLLEAWEKSLEPPAWQGSDSRYFFCGRTIDARN